MIELQTITSQSKDILLRTLRDEEKMSRRKVFLKNYPEKRIRINVKKLKQIINFFDFKCHPNCSIARDQAIKGSDIDGGLIILTNEATIEQQLEFVSELRRQGFNVSHRNEILELQQQLNTTSLHVDPETREYLGLKYDELSNAEIRFTTQSQLDNQENFDPIYIAGYSIKTGL